MPRVSRTTRRFEALLEKERGGLGWTIARVPFTPSDVWPQQIRLRVRGTVNGFAFRSSLLPSANEPGAFFLLVNRNMQQHAHVREGQRAIFELDADLDPRPAELPEELDALLDEAEGLRDFYNGLTEYMRREIGKWISGVKSDDARLRRAQQMAERLLSTMEAETELPPLIARALSSRPKAQAGWHKLTPAQRRGELFAVFYYQSPEAKQKRLDKLCALAESKA
ncbi:YdeI/OmpD-associated family protein [Terriglobus aquaticus]|uniref:YdeI/OmpD-associated family protein n=1 Tax=Terriglobus aquaticus TaxID=940139 RepID=A0ABW9KM18_9BACT|nr:YdeI/OmpD-associated family protein [Terriglobus aquaticus]